MKESVKDRAPNIAAALAYYMFLSLAPLVGFILFLSFRILGTAQTSESVRPFLEALLPEQFINVILFFLKRNINGDLENWYTISILSGIALAYSTFSFFGMIKDTIDITWNIRRERAGFMAFLQRQLEDAGTGAGAIGILAFFILIGSLVIPSRTFAGDSSFFNYLKQGLFEFTVFFTLLYFYFFVLPPLRIRPVNVILPAAIGALLHVAGRSVLKIHLHHQPQADLTESLLVVLFWFYYSNVVFVYSAEFSRIYISKKQNII